MLSDSVHGIDSEAERDTQAVRRGADYTLAFDRPNPIRVPRVCPDIEPIGGYLKFAIEDFRVEEVPLYRFGGHGEHCFVTFRKRNRTTLQVRDMFARALGISAEDIGFAGFKDKRAETTQVFSLRGVDNDHVAALDLPIDILDITRHKNKLRPGHLSRNRFEIRVRAVRDGALDAARSIVAEIERFGLPNYYGTQRFGFDLSSYKIGHALLHREPKQALDGILGPNDAVDEEFRELYAEGRYAEALAALPGGRAPEATLLRALERFAGNHRAAARRIPRQLRKMYFSAYQSFLFNWAVLERLEWGHNALARCEPGDLAMIHGKGACFEVDDIDEANARVAAGEISPSGPIFGRKMTFAKGRPGALEWAILAAEGMRPQSFLSHVKGLKLDGTRRAMAIPIRDVSIIEPEAGVLDFRFELPPGCYATTLLEQVMGPGQTDKRPTSAELDGAEPLGERDGDAGD